MSAHPRLSLNQATIKYADLDQALRSVADGGYESIGLWREPVQAVGLDEAARRLADSGLRLSTYCRGGFFTVPEGPARRAAIDDNRRGIEETATLAAAGAPGSRAVFVLVAGGIPEGSTDLVGLLLFEFIVTWPNGRQQTFPSDGFERVRISLDGA